MVVDVHTDEGKLSFEAPTLEVARLVANSLGYNVDLEPMEPGKCRLTAQKGSITIRINGTTVYDAAGKLIKKLELESHEQV